MANMFGALNRFMARLDSDPNNIPQSKTSGAGGAGSQQRPSSSSGSNLHGFQILRNTDPNLPLEPWFDYLIGINGRTIDNPTASLLATELQNCAGSTISLGIYTAKGGGVRELYAPIPAQGGLGLTLQWSPLAAADDVWHILDVMPNSPADAAGLLPYGDWLIGSPERGALRGEAALGELVDSFLDRPLRLWVYNSEYDVVRLVTLTPARSWGGDGALGCLLGYGALHRLPAPLAEPSQAPGETLFEAGAGYESEKVGFIPTDSSAAAMRQQDNPSAESFLVPAEMEAALSSPPPPSAGQGASAPPAPGKPRKQRAHAPAAGLDDYFAEGEQKSRELDGGSGSRPSASLAPPPPKGGPPRATSPSETDTDTGKAADDE